jgi:tetratricopeptide (TPR) repeat protein
MRQAERQHKEHVQAIDRATEQQSRESERQHQELLEATGWPAAEQQAAALIEAAERRRRTTANALSLDARAKSERAVSLYDSGMYDEAYQLAVQSIEQDPDNLDRFWRKLVGRGDFATASKLAEHLSTRLDSLLAECYLCQGYSHFGRDGKGRIDAFVAKAAIGSRRALEADLAQIRQASDEGRLSQDIVAHAVRSLSEKYRQWKSAIETQLRDEAVASTKSVQVKTGAGVCGVLSFVVLALVSGTYCLSHGFRPDSTGPIAPFGSLFGAILIGVLYGRYVKRLRTGPIMWKNLTAAFSEENRRLGKLGLPTLTPPSQSDSLHLFEPLIYGGIIAVYIGVWFSLMAGQGRPSRTGSANNPPAFSSNRAALPGAHVALKDAGIFTDELTNTSSGNVYGISWTNGIGNHGAVFSAANSSRIEYAGEVPREGTFELWINVASGYRYDDYTFRGDLETAMVFSTDVQGGDVTWPGTTKFYVSRNGNVSLVVAENKYDNPPTNAIEAQGTPFRFGEWHAVGFSAGSLGEYIMVDGKVVAAAPTRTQQIGCAGTHQAPADLPTVGETASHYWPRHRYEGGFEGIVARFRASPKQQDWYLARGIFEKESRDRAHVAAANGADQQSAGRTEESYTRQDRQQNQSRGRPEGAGGPAIASFEAVPFAAGGPGVMILRWTITGATAASIEPGVGAVRPSSGYKIVRPVQTTTYTLQVKGEGESSVSRDVTFTVSSAGKPN